MAKRSWFSLLKRFFISENGSSRTKERRRRWVFGRHKLKRLTSISAPTEKPPESQPHEDKQVLDGEILSSSSHQFEMENGAAIKIQTAFRGFLARKALRALEGVVKLQAIIRGCLIRRQAVTTLKRLQSIVNIHSQVCANRVQMADFATHNSSQENDHGRGKDIKIDINSQKRWDDSILTKEEENALFWSKREAAMKRERIKEYTYNHRMSSESEHSKVNGKWRYWLEQWVDSQLAKREDLENKEKLESQKVKLRNLKGIDSPTRRSLHHHRKQRSIGEENSISMAGAPAIPTYMAATESARAKARSLSSPRLRPISLDTCSENNSPYKHKLLSPISSINSDATSISKIWNVNNGGGLSQRSPSLKGVPNLVKSNRSFKDIGLNSDCSLPKFDLYGHFR